MRRTLARKPGVHECLLGRARPLRVLPAHVGDAEPDGVPDVDEARMIRPLLEERDRFPGKGLQLVGRALARQHALERGEDPRGRRTWLVTVRQRTFRCRCGDRRGLRRARLHAREVELERDVDPVGRRSSAPRARSAAAAASSPRQRARRPAAAIRSPALRASAAFGWPSSFR